MARRSGAECLQLLCDPVGVLVLAVMSTGKGETIDEAAVMENVKGASVDGEAVDLVPVQMV